MSWRFRQSFKILPGLKLNLSRTGLSASIGGAPFTLNVGPRGVYGAASIPGTGVSFRQRLSGGADGPCGSESVEVPELPRATTPPSHLPAANLGSQLPHEIRSASTELLTSESLKELKQLIQTAYEEHEEIRREFSAAKQEAGRVTARFKSWENGFLLKRLFKASFSVRKAEAEIATARAGELEEQLRLTTITTQFELAKEQADPFFRLRDDFTGLAECAAIWDIKAEQSTDRVRERTVATKSVSREKVKFSLGVCDLIQWDQSVPHLQNANGGDLFLYPGFILYRASKTAFSVIDYHDVCVEAAGVRFHEADGVPSDSQTVGQTWAKTNKDGSRDKRFADNYQIPIVVYGQLTLKSETGLWEQYQLSNPERLERFANSWKAFVTSFANRISLSFVPEEPPASGEDVGTQDTSVGNNTAIHFECGACRQQIEVNAEAASQEFRCPGCGEKLVVPESSI